MPRTQNLTNLVVSRTGTICLATTARRTLVCLRKEMLAPEAKDVEGAMDSPLSVAAPRARSPISTRRMSPVSLWSTTRLVLLAGAAR